MTVGVNHQFSVLHLIDETFDSHSYWSLQRLLDRLPRDTFRQHLASIDGPARAMFDTQVDDVAFCPRRFSLDLTAAPSIRRLLNRKQNDIVHAWGVQAAAACRLADRRIPIVLSLSQPGLDDAGYRWVQTLSSEGPLGVACESGVVRRRLVEHGLDIERCAVIRPAVDFSLLNRVGRADRRAALGVDADTSVLLAGSPHVKGNSLTDSVWAGAIAGLQIPGLTLIIPGRSREQARARHLARSQPSLVRCIFTDDAYSLPELLAISNMMVVPADRDVATTSIAWAMAAGLVVVGSAVPSITEMIVHRNNGLLVKPGEVFDFARRVVEGLEDADLAGKLREEARSQAFQVFGLRRFVDQFQTLYVNLLQSGRAGGCPDSSGRSPAIPVNPATMV